MAHGFTDNSMCMKPIIKKLPFDSKGIAYDAKTYGLSDAPTSGYGRDDMAKDLVGIVQELEINNPVLYGHSLGANTVARSSEMLEDIRFCILENPTGLKINSLDKNKRTKRIRSKFDEWRTSTHREIREKYTRTPNVGTTTLRTS